MSKNDFTLMADAILGDPVDNMIDLTDRLFIVIDSFSASAHITDLQKITEEFRKYFEINRTIYEQTHKKALK